MRNIILNSVLSALLPVAVLAQKPDTIVKLAAKPVHPGVATLREEVSIGLIEGEEEYLFGQIAEMAVAPDGAIYVFDAQVPALRKYDARGKYVRTVGRKGQGPGEYMYGGGLAVGPDGKVYLWDTGTWRINVYSPAGEYLQSYATPSGLGANTTFKTSRGLLLDTQGALFYRASRRGQPGTPSTPVWIRMVNGAIADTVEVPTPGPPAPQLTASVKTATSSATSSTGLPFAPVPLAQLSPLGYFVTSYPSRYAFEFPAGRNVVSVRRDVKPEPVTAAERAQEKKKVEDLLRRTQPNWNWNGPDIPRTKSAFDAIAIGADARVWIPLVRQPGNNGGGVSFSTQSSRPGTSANPGASPRDRGNAPREKPRPGLFDVYEPNGTYLGQVAVPAGVSLLYRRGDYVWGTALDEFDVATVKRYRIQWKN